MPKIWLLSVDFDVVSRTLLDGSREIFWVVVSLPKGRVDASTNNVVGIVVVVNTHETISSKNRALPKIGALLGEIPCRNFFLCIVFAFVLVDIGATMPAMMYASSASTTTSDKFWAWMASESKTVVLFVVVIECIVVDQVCNTMQ